MSPRSKIAASLASAVSDPSGRGDDAEPPVRTPAVTVLDHDGEDTVKVALENRDEATTLTTGPMDVRLVDRDRVPHTVDTDRLDALDDPFPTQARIPPGENRQGWMVFERPVGSGPRWVRFDGDHGEVRTRVDGI